MSIAAGTGGRGPCEPREPGEAPVRGPVFANVRSPERDYVEPESMRVLKELHVNSAAAEQRVVEAGEREPAGNGADVSPERELVPARSTQYQRVGAGVARRFRGRTRVDRVVSSWVEKQNKDNMM